MEVEDVRRGAFPRGQLIDVMVPGTLTDELVPQMERLLSHVLAFSAVSLLVLKGRRLTYLRYAIAFLTVHCCQWTFGRFWRRRRMRWPSLLVWTS
jgi:hypothetical protein